MLTEIKELQKNAVTRLLELVSSTGRNTFTFRAPTGSGKTFMMADFMNRLLAEDHNVIFLVSSLSKSDLAKQNYDKFCEYREKMGFTNLCPYLISSDISGEERLYIPSEYNVYLLPRDLYKQDSRLMGGPMLAFLTEMRFEKNTKIVWIRDECHIRTANLDALVDDYFDCTINFSATPNLGRGQHPDVEITDAEAENCKLIKRVVWGGEDATVEDAINKFIEIKADYRNLLDVNPCLIIQISNKKKADEELANDIFPALNAHPELKWMLIVDKSENCDTNDVFKAKKIPVNRWKDYAKDSLNGIDIIIFKLVISEGWDIPRACMLYQTRESRSKQLDEQVVGRIRRNPRLMDFETLDENAQKLATTAWAWGISPSSSGKSYAVRLQDDKEDIKQEIKVKTTTLHNLNEKEVFDLEAFLEAKKKNTPHNDIFSLYRNIEKVEPSIKQMLYDKASNYSKWWDIAENILDIESEYGRYYCDYIKSMTVGDTVTLPDQSYYVASDKNVNISNWVWKRKDGAERFSFDSDAERDWADILKDLSFRAICCIETGKKKSNAHKGEQTIFGDVIPDFILESRRNVYIWGKNFVADSEIKFEYYLGALHFSYPDFIVKDRFGRIHIFEVKSVNQSSTLNIDNNIYLSKVEELKKCYKQASLLTDQCFYLPIQRDDVWIITLFNKGEESIITLDQFRSFIETEPS